MAALSVLSVSLATVWKLICWLAIIVSLVRHNSGGALFGHNYSPDCLQELLWLQGDHWELYSSDGNKEKAVMQKQWYVQPWIVILCFKNASRKKRNLVLLPDQMSGDEFRKLRVRLLLFSE